MSTIRHKWLLDHPPVPFDHTALEHLPRIGLDGLGLYLLILVDEQSQHWADKPKLESYIKQLGMPEEKLDEILARLRCAELIQIIEDGGPKWRQEVQRATPSVKEPVPRRYKETDPGYVYVINGGEYHKIGKAREPQRRIKQLQGSSSTVLSFAHLILTEHMSWTEDVLHTRFHKQRSHGEWFALTTDDLAWIKREFPVAHGVNGK